MAYIKAPLLLIYNLKDCPITEQGIYTTTITHYAYFTYAGKCELYFSLLWDVEYYTVGSFEIYLLASAENLELFQIDRIVVRPDDTENFGVIESIKIEHDSENGDYLTVSGRFLPCLLERRVIFPTAYSKDITVGNCPLLSTTTKNYENMVKHVLLGGYGHPYYLAGSADIGLIVSGVYGTNGGAMKETTFSRNGRRMIPGLWVQDEQSDVWYARIGTLSGDDVADDDSGTTSSTMQVTGKNLME
ncbi:MAG: siphovirus ReqiPepy6 Gp37-like family protein [Ruminococcus sp.]|nr:siphovirus ReqiPepy6 Gp37-like family protein [Ruminococcus sp.]